MKKICSALLIVICMSMAMPAMAQFSFGVKGGLNLSKASFSDFNANFKKDNFTGFFIGPTAEFTIPVVGLGIDGSLLFSQRGVQVNGEKVKQNGIDIPINLKYTIGLGSLLGVYVAAGPDFYFDFAKDKSILGINVDKHNRQVGFNVGAGVKLLGHLQLGVNYNFPLGKTGDLTFNNLKNSYQTSYKTKTWQASVAYMF